MGASLPCKSTDHDWTYIDGFVKAVADSFILSFTSFNSENIQGKDGLYSVKALNCVKRAIKAADDEDSCPRSSDNFPAYW